MNIINRLRFLPFLRPKAHPISGRMEKTPSAEVHHIAKIYPSREKEKFLTSEFFKSIDAQNRLEDENMGLKGRIEAKDQIIFRLKQRYIQLENAQRAQHKKLESARILLAESEAATKQLKVDLHLTRSALNRSIEALDEIGRAGVPGGPILNEPVREIAGTLRNIAQGRWERPLPPSRPEREHEADRLIAASRRAFEASRASFPHLRRPERADEILRDAYAQQMRRPLNEARMIREAEDYLRTNRRGDLRDRLLVEANVIDLDELDEFESVETII